MRLAAGVGVLVSGAILGFVAGAVPGSPQELPKGVTPQMIEEGREIFIGQGLCSVCHGPEGRGGAIGPDLSDEEWLHGDGSYEFIVRRVTEGVPQPVNAAATMPPKGGSRITDEQVRAVAAYVWSLRLSG